MGADPLVSVVVPTRRRRQQLLQTLSSIASQQVPLEVIVVEDRGDGSADHVLTRLADRRFRLISSRAVTGVSAARNIGVAEARGRWVAFCDDDDVWAPTKLEAQLDAVEAAGTDWSVTDALHLDSLLRPFALDRIEWALEEALAFLNVVPGGGSGVLARTEAVREVGGFDEGLGFSADWDLWVRLLRRSSAAFVPQPLVGYRVWRGSKFLGPGIAASMLAEREIVWSCAGARSVPEGWLYLSDRRNATQLHRSGLRLAAARMCLAVGRRHRRPAMVARAFGMLVAPGVYEGLRRSMLLGQVPSEVLETAERWLAPLREIERGN